MIIELRYRNIYFYSDRLCTISKIDILFKLSTIYVIDKSLFSALIETQMSAVAVSVDHHATKWSTITKTLKQHPYTNAASGLHNKYLKASP